MLHHPFRHLFCGVRQYVRGVYGQALALNDAFLHALPDDFCENVVQGCFLQPLGPELRQQAWIRQFFLWIQTKEPEKGKVEVPSLYDLLVGQVIDVFQKQQLCH